MALITAARGLAALTAVAAGVVGLGAWAACAPFDDAGDATATGDEGGVVVDSASDQAVAEGSPPPPDSSVGTDAALDSDGCLPLIPAVFNAPQGWMSENSATIVGTNQAILGDVSAESSGAIYLMLAAPISAFKIRFTLAIAPLGAADGIALAWVSTPDDSLPSIGGTAEALGFCPKDATNTGPTMGNALGFEVLGHTLWTKSVGPMTQTCPGIDTGTTNTFQGTTQIDVHVTPTRVTGTIAGDSFSLANLPTHFQWIGITAGTGKSGANFTISDLSIAICK